jgi:hypothetical protein
MSNGNENVPSEINTELAYIHVGLLAEGWELWRQYRDNVTRPGLNYKTDEVKFSRVSIVTFSQIAAVTAVDVGLTEEQFLATCKANYVEATKRAVRWG